MALSKSEYRRLVSVIDKLKKRAFDISLDGEIVTFHSPSGSVVGKHVFGREHEAEFPPTVFGVTCMIMIGLIQQAAIVCGPDHKEIEDINAGWVADSCKVLVVPCYDYKNHVFEYTWRVGPKEKCIGRCVSYDEWPKTSELLKNQNELIQCYKRLLPLSEHLEQQGLQVEFLDEALCVGQFAIYLREGKLVGDRRSSHQSLEDPEGLAELSQDIVTLNSLKSFFSSEAKNFLELKAPQQWLECDFEPL